MTPEPVSIQPGSAVEVAAALKRASDAQQSIVIRGAGTKDGWGRPAGRIDAVLDMRRLNRILAHEHGDMTATIEAGAGLRDVNQALAAHGQMLPLDPPFADRATIGGLLATNDSGPLRHRYGTPRDLVIGVQLATTDGVLAKAGGQVVKNVAGYDLSKLVTGSFGSLAAIVSATFKLSPLPAASQTLTMTVADTAALAEIVRIVMSSQLEPIAFEVVAGHGSWVMGRSPDSNDQRPTDEQRPVTNDSRPVTNDSRPVTNDSRPVTNDSRPVTNDSRPMTNDHNHSVVLLRFASLPAVVDAQIAQATAALKACVTSIESVDGVAERALWDAHATGIWDRPGAVVRASWLPANIAAGLDELAGLKPCATSQPAALKPRATSERAAPGMQEVSPPVTLAAVAQGFSPALTGRAAVGAGLICIDGDPARQATAIEQLRASSVFGNIVIVRGSAELKARVDVWGSHGSRQPLFDSLKRAFDPNNVLNAGRGPL